MKAILLYFQTQKMFLFMLVSMTLLPFYLLCKFMPEIPYTQYFFLIVIFCLKMIIFNQRTLKLKLTPIVRKKLQKELKKNPTDNAIFKRVMFHIHSRDLSMMFSAIGIFIIGIVFRRF